MKKNGFTLIELLAVIIILAIVALISTPIILNVVDEARESANKLSVAMYADAVKLAVIDNYFENQVYPTIDKNWALANVEYGGEKITCEAIYYTENEGVTLHECALGGQAFNYVDEMEVSAESTVYCYTKGKVYIDCTDAEYVTYYTAVIKGTSVSPSIVAFNNAKGVNAPQLLEGMTSIRYDGSNWVMANTNEDWYDYSSKQWANVVVLNEGITKNVGDTINVNTEVSLMYVWIPRYAYMIGAGYHTSTVNSISIEFLKDDTINNVNGTVVETTGYVAGSKDTSNNYFLHPAFENADTKYGFWVAKFEASGSSNNITIKPGVTSLRSIAIGDIFDASIAMKDKTLYGFNASETESHLMTNYEWGALAYLSQSIYGKNSEVWINNSSTYITGCAGNSVDASQYSGCENAYNTTNGQKSSTTGNITGVYDMTGGTFEYIAGYLNNGHSNLTTNGNSLFISTSGYKNIYAQGTIDDRTNNYEENKNVYGDAVYETSSSGSGYVSWNSAKSCMSYSNNPFFYRGGFYSSTTNAGVFNFSDGNGSASSVIGFRPVVVKVQS